MNICECCGRSYDAPMMAIQGGYNTQQYCSLACAKKAGKSDINVAGGASVSASSTDGDVVCALFSLVLKLVGFVFKILGWIFKPLYKWVFSKSIKTPLGIILRIIFIGIPMTVVIVAGFIIWKRLQ